jgi:hypothetical protein
MAISAITLVFTSCGGRGGASTAKSAADPQTDQQQDTRTAILTEELPTTSDFPKVNGNVVKAVRYKDKTGDNLILLTETEIVSNAKPDVDYPLFPPRSKELFAYRFLMRPGGNTYEQAWRITDFVRECDLYEMYAAFVEDAFRITDLNNDGVAEIWVVYMLTCRGDITPRTMKIIMYEGGKKYAVRGEALSMNQYSEDEFEYIGGGYTLDDAFNAAPEYKDFAVDLWETFKKPKNFWKTDE